jgi:UDP-glucose 4-epimerase
MRFLVTGTSGFIGTSLCERLSSRSVHDVTGVDRLTPREVFDGVEYCHIELRNSNDVTGLVQEARPDVIVHLAAQARVDPSLRSAEPTYRDNVESTINLLAAAESLGNRLERFVYASSAL